MRTVRLRVRARVDRVRYSIGHEWPVLLSAVGVLIGVVTILPSAVGVVLSLVALVLGVVTLVRDVRGFRRRWARHDFARVVATFRPASCRRRPLIWRTPGISWCRTVARGWFPMTSIGR